jgi:hypothetical protein
MRGRGTGPGADYWDARGDLVAEVGEDFEARGWGGHLVDFYEVRRQLNIRYGCYTVIVDSKTSSPRNTHFTKFTFLGATAKTLAPGLGEHKMTWKNYTSDTEPVT